ncbi:hypothetical protein J4456_02565 [Candidatus Pacearchaeota archaeon]|nr:hypothetical protein [Candidatus Pacearchaeota archaeon]
MTEIKNKRILLSSPRLIKRGNLIKLLLNFNTVYIPCEVIEDNNLTDLLYRQLESLKRQRYKNEEKYESTSTILSGIEYKIYLITR